MVILVCDCEGGMNPVVCFQVVDVLSKNKRPKILAKKLYHVKRIVEPWPILGKPAHSSALGSLIDYQDKATFQQDPDQRDTRQTQAYTSQHPSSRHQVQ